MIIETIKVMYFCNIIQNNCYLFKKIVKEIKGFAKNTLFIINY